jgi:hypothetical protein
VQVSACLWFIFRVCPCVACGICFHALGVSLDAEAGALIVQLGSNLWARAFWGASQRTRALRVAVSAISHMSDEAFLVGRSTLTPSEPLHCLLIVCVCCWCLARRCIYFCKSAVLKVRPVSSSPTAGAVKGPAYCAAAG